MAACRRRMEQCKTLALACCNADGVRGKKLELEHFLNQHGVHICLLSETFLNPVQAYRLANYICHRTERITRNFSKKRLSFPRREQSLRYRPDRWPPLQANAPKLPVLHSPYSLILLQVSDVQSVLPDGHIISSGHAGCVRLGWINLPCPLQSVCQQHAFTLTPHRVGPPRGRHGHHSHVPQADAPCQLPGVIPQRSSTVVE